MGMTVSIKLLCQTAFATKFKAQSPESPRIESCRKSFSTRQAGGLVSVITTASVKSMKLKRGKVVTALVKATNLSLKDCDCGQH